MSLKRLRTDYIDLYQLHWPGLDTPIEETAQAMLDLKKAGKALAIGVSNYSPEQMKQFHAIAPLSSDQPPLNLFEREAQREVIPWCHTNGVATLTYGSLCRGLLTGTIDERAVFQGDDLRKEALLYIDEIVTHSVRDPIGPGFMAPPEHKPHPESQRAVEG
jgi:aryl-alcohol dehydrogenase-like predicted oxidoreductase